MIITKITTDQRIEAVFAYLNKNNTLNKYYTQIEQGESGTEKCKITETIFLTEFEWNDFVDHLLTGREWLAKKGGHGSDFETKYNCDTERGQAAFWADTEEVAAWREQVYRLVIKVRCNDLGKEIYVDPQGHNYARYVGVPKYKADRLKIAYRNKVGAEVAEIPAEIEKAEMPAPSGNGLLIENIQDRSSKRGSQTILGRIAQGQHAEIVKNKSIRLFGIDTNRYGGPKAYDITFGIGGYVEYDSYNLSYLGEITAIGEKTVSIKPDHRGGTRRLSIYEFNWRNHNFDLERIQHDNAETSMTI